MKKITVALSCQRSDYERAVELARGFRGEAPRANATIAILRIKIK